MLAEIDDYFASRPRRTPSSPARRSRSLGRRRVRLRLHRGRLADRGATELGLEVAPSVSELDTSDGGFFYELSYEQLDQLEADFIVSYHNTEDEAKAFLTKSELQAIPAVAAAIRQVGTR